MLKKLAVIGANGYIGQHIVKHLCNEYDVTAIHRGTTPIQKQINGVQYQTMRECEQTFDIIINTAYNLSADVPKTKADNDALVEFILSISNSDTKLIHLSSLAVFGFKLDYPLIPQGIALHQDYTYVQSKIHIENRLLSVFKHENISILRLGNVWGNENSSYTIPVIDALLFGLPVLYDKKSYCNITYIHNITSYIHHILRQKKHMCFHHLAEWSGITWGEMIHDIADILHVEPQPITHLPYYPESLYEELSTALLQSPLTALRSLKNGRFTPLIFPYKLFHALNTKRTGIRKPNVKSTLPPYRAADTFYWILSAEKRFPLHVLEGWEAPYDWKSTVPDLKTWMKEAGYLI